MKYEEWSMKNEEDINAVGAEWIGGLALAAGNPWSAEVVKRAKVVIFYFFIFIVRIQPACRNDGQIHTLRSPSTVQAVTIGL